MPPETSPFAAFLGALRVALFALAVILAVVALLDWMVRTRRINAFNPVARFMRRTVDPLLRPIEARVVRAGGMPASAPWWALGVVVIGGIILLTLLEWLGGQFNAARYAAGAGPTGILRLVVSWIFGILKIALIVRVISSWFRISPYSKWIHWSFQLTEPIIGPLRRVIPPIGMIDITPIVAYIVLIVLERIVMGVM